MEGVENQGPLPTALILAQHGHVIHRVTGSPFVWNFIFLSGGRQVAFETGPLHFSMQCVLMDTTTAKPLSTYDCFEQPLPTTAPAWVKHLESTASLQHR